MKQAVKSIPWLNRGLRPIWDFYKDYGDPLSPFSNLRRVFRGADNLQVVQIGSNDGKANDPLRRMLRINGSWRALFVEPVPFLFEKLRKNYGEDARFSFENVAISSQAGEIPFYYLPEETKQRVPNLPSWYDQLGSFNADHIPDQLGEQMRPYIVTVQIVATPLQVVLERNHIDKLDLLHIDTEGADWSILRQLDLNRYRPKVILVEHRHLSPEERKEMDLFLQPHYQVTDLGADLFCERKNS